MIAVDMQKVNLGTGDAPCGNCGRHIWNIPVLLDTQEPDGKGGYWWQVAAGGQCLDCGEPLVWFHKSAPFAMDFSGVNSVTETVLAQDNDR